MSKHKIAIFIPAYKAVKTLDAAIRRIPSSLKNQVAEIYVFDDASDDNTYLAGIGYKLLHNIKKLNIYKNPKNLGYGGNQKKGYNYAIKKGYDIVVMLHGDVQYAPEKIPQLIKPIERGEADVVFGSRILGTPLRQGMPLWKYIGNRVLTTIENMFLPINLSEFHTGFRAFRCDALKDIPYTRCSNDYDFDTEVVLQLVLKNKRFKEIPIPTHYGPESHQITFLLSVEYGLRIMRSLIQYKLHTLGFKKIRKFDF
jgi:glycosyltransferase involved in cell wall biosynthesis|tara:strand:- start:315 stop:1079 length:765 start_codon:yes stop_codon:yes gene_type:complete